MLDHKLKKCQCASEKEKQDRTYGGYQASGNTKCQIVKHDEKCQQCQDADQVIGQIQPQSEEFEISYKELEHKMIFYILPSKMRILGREIISQ